MGRISIEGYEPGHLSYSTVNSYRMCAKQFYFTKVAKVEQLPGLAAIGGNAVHNVLEALAKAEFFGTEVDTLSEGER